MDVIKGKGKKGLIKKTLEKCKTFAGKGKKSSSNGDHAFRIKKSRSWPHLSSSSKEEEKTRKNCKVAPEGCFSVYVGPEKQRFVIKTESLNHPLFKMLLEEAESEYGHDCRGPLMLPCDVGCFVKVLMEMDCEEIRHGCSFARFHSSYHLLTPPRMVAINQF